MDNASSFNRRFVIAVGCVAAALAVLPAPTFAAPFKSSRISVVTRGQGRDVVLIHGLGASRGVWNATVAAVPGYRYHLVQINGFAGAPPGGNVKGPVVAPVAAEVARYVAEARLGKPAIIGHSMGGTIAMLLAARHPARVGKAMVVDMLPQPAGLVGLDASRVRPLADGLRDLFGGSAEGRRLFGSLIGGGQAGQPGNDADVTARAAHELALLDLTPELRRIAVPLRVVYATPVPGGRIDPARITHNYRAAYAGAKTATLVAVANSGHMVMADQSAKFRAEMRAFLK